ncbi:tissue factor pathway inhibitor 2-like [Haliotis rufescens]|uniref:tissue factor pathway inhibitor 2-like n=1 Tax=Haliotis rufescens TaxID=6454 RepID=UPI00201EE093|nr:tissue factor pathway inhibitor 2-like [Haliotis rufescens]
MSTMMLVVALIMTCAIPHGHGVADTNETTSQRTATSMASAEGPYVLGYMRTIRCFFICRRGMTDTRCDCSRCKTKVCQAGQRCKMNEGNPVCVADREVCQLTRELGPCRALMPRYFYNQATRRCQQFYYGGCQGNGNNFKTRGDCVATCRRRGVVCESGRMNIQPFIFVIILTCAVVCVTGDDKKEGTTTAPVTKGKPAPPRYKPDTRPQLFNCYYLCQTGMGSLYCRCPQRVTCKTKICSDGYVCIEVYGHARCVPDTSVCRLPKVSGHCKAYMPRYYYNSYSRRCERFIYGGCGGNGNNFKTLDECYRRCGIRYRGDAY